MARIRLLLPVAVACVIGSALIPGAAQAAHLSPPPIQPTQPTQPTQPAHPTASLVDDLAPGPASSDPRDLTAMNGKLFFTA